MVGVLLFLVLVGAWVGIRGLLAKGELDAALPLASRIQEQVLSGDADGAAASVAALQAHSSSARSLTSDVIWRGVEVVPLLGGNLRVVRELTEVVDDLAAKGVAPLAGLAGQFDASSLRPVNGAIDVQPFVDAAPLVSSASDAINKAKVQVHSVRRDDAVGVLRDAADELEASVDKVAAAMDTLDGALQLIPSMLGGEGPRNYLVVIQNPAEPRAGGGITSAFALVATDNGRAQLVQQASSSTFPEYDAPVLELPLETRSLYGDQLGEYVQNATLTPQFPLSGKLLQEFWARQFGTRVDGVIAVDPIALSYLLKATGPITLDTGDELSAGNAVPMLLKDVYERYALPEEQDAFFASAAAAVFSTVLAGNAEPAGMLEAFALAGSEGRILMWLDDDAEQSVIAETTLAGGLPLSDPEATRIGLYFNEAGGTKVGYYLEREITVASSVCRNDGLRSVEVDVTLTNTLPIGTVLPDYVTAYGRFVQPGNLRLLVAAYAPPGSINQGVQLVTEGSEPEAMGAHQTTDSEYVVSQVSVELAPEQSQTVRFSMLLGADSGDRIQIVPTPGIYVPVTRNNSLLC